MGIFLYKSKNLDIPESSMTSYCNSIRYNDIATPELLKMSLNQMMSQTICFLSPFDSAAIRVLMSTKVKRNLKVYTTSMAVGQVLSFVAADIAVLDSQLVSAPNLWDTTVTRLDNQKQLRKLSIPSIVYDINMSSSMSVYHFELVEDKNMEVSFFKLTNFKEADFIKDIKIEMKSYGKSKSADKSALKREVKSNLATIGKSGLSKAATITSASDIKEYMIAAGYLTRADIESLEENHLDTPLEIQASERGLLSDEDTVEIVRNFYNLEMLDKEVLRTLCIEYSKVSESLRDKGVIEAYEVNDEERVRTFIIIPYTLRGKLVDDIKSSIDFTKLIYTVPAYIKGLV